MTEFNAREEKHIDIKTRKPSKREQYEKVIEELKKLPPNDVIFNTIMFLEDNKHLHFLLQRNDQILYLNTPLVPQHSKILFS